MKYSVKLSDAVHILSYIHFSTNPNISSKDIAFSVKTNPSYVRKLMSAMKEDNIISNSQGKANAKISRDINDISLYDIYKAVEKDKPLLHLDIHINPECGLGVNMQYVMQDVYEELHKKIYKEMQDIKLSDLFKKYQHKISL